MRYVLYVVRTVHYREQAGRIGGPRQRAMTVGKIIMSRVRRLARQPDRGTANLRYLHTWYLANGYFPQ